LPEGKFTVEQLVKIATSHKSQYYDGIIEGIVCRVSDDNDQYLAKKGKIVRSDFIAGDQFWAKSKYVVNQINN
jgi:atypical dual specificity phosphatase